MSSPCPHENEWFARNLCAERCGSMHAYCNHCGERTDNHTHADTSVPVEIPLPPEPPRTRVIEAVDADGVVRIQFAHNGTSWAWIGGYASWDFDGIVPLARRAGYTLRHRAAESGGAQ